MIQSSAVWTITNNPIFRFGLFFLRGSMYPLVRLRPVRTRRQGTRTEPNAYHPAPPPPHSFRHPHFAPSFSRLADDSKNESISSKLSPTRSYARRTLDRSKPFIASSWTEFGYSSAEPAAIASTAGARLPSLPPARRAATAGAAAAAARDAAADAAAYCWEDDDDAPPKDAEEAAEATALFVR